MPELIASHVWRPPTISTRRGRGGGLTSDRPCEYMNCRRPRAEHERSVSLRHSRWGAS